MLKVQPSIIDTMLVVAKCISYFRKVPQLLYTHTNMQAKLNPTQGTINKLNGLFAEPSRYHISASVSLDGSPLWFDHCLRLKTPQ